MVITNLYGVVTSAVAPLALDHSPVARAEVLQRFASGGLRISALDLLENDTDADGDGLGITGVSNPTAAGGTVALSGPYIYYSPPPVFTNSDSFTYSITDGHCGASAIANVTIQIKPDDTRPLHLGLVQQSNGSYSLAFDGIPGFCIPPAIH